MLKRVVCLILMLVSLSIDAGRNGNHGYSKKGKNSGVVVDWKYINRQQCIANIAKTKKHYESWKKDKNKVNDCAYACVYLSLIMGWATVGSWLYLNQYKGPA